MTVKRNEKLKTIGDVSHFLAKIINQVVRDEINESKAAKLGYLSNILIGIIRDQELEERVKKLEESLNTNKP